MDLREQLTKLWAAGGSAPYDLYEAKHTINGQRVLVEAGQELPAVIRRGDSISAEIAERVRLQLYPAKPEAVLVDVPQRDENGVVVRGADDVPVIESVEIEVEPEIPLLSVHGTTISADDDIHCDMCGEERQELVQLGRGWYCKTPRLPAGEGDPITCYDLRLRQLGVTP